VSTLVYRAAVVGAVLWGCLDAGTRFAGDLLWRAVSGRYYDGPMGPRGERRY
jgi:hypothetical protein